MPRYRWVGVIVLSTLATSAAGCVVNDLWDRDIDLQNARTRDRPLAVLYPSKSASSLPNGSVGQFWVSRRCLNPLSFWLCVAAVPVIVLYPLASGCFQYPNWKSFVAGRAVLISWSAATARLEFATAALGRDCTLDTRIWHSLRHERSRRWPALRRNSSALFFLVTMLLLPLVFSLLALSSCWGGWVLLCSCIWASGSRSCLLP